MGTQSVPEPSSSIQNDNNPQKIENAPPSLSKSVTNNRKDNKRQNI